MRKALPLACVLLLTCLSAAQVSYSIRAGADEVRINTTLLMDCDGSETCPVNSWSLAGWPLPEGAVVEDVRDGQGSIEDYTVENGRLSLETNTGPRRRSETVRIQMRIAKDAEEIYRGLKQRKISLAGVSGERTTGSVKVEDLISGRTSFGFHTTYSGNSMNFSGEGPLNLRVKFGEGNETRYYEFFGADDVKNSELAYEVSVGTTGLVQGFRRFPVAVMDSRTFNETVGRWSAGEYIGGSIKIRSGLGEGEKAAVLAHETVHGLNDRELRWDATKSSYIDEGTGKFVEFLVRKKLTDPERIPELFGEKKTFTEERNGRRYRITVPSRGNPEELWRYYQENRSFMKNWNPSDFPGVRSFGYAYSELVIRNYVVNMNGSVKDIYREVSPEKEISSAQEKWSLYSRELDLTPCKKQEREEFRKCLERINNHEYSYTRAMDIDRRDNRIKVEQIQLKDGKPGKQENRGLNSSSDPGTFKKRLESRGAMVDLIKIFSDFIGFLKGVFG